LSVDCALRVSTGDEMNDEERKRLLETTTEQTERLFSFVDMERRYLVLEAGLASLQARVERLESVRKIEVRG
jgi:hypothetical protein